MIQECWLVRHGVTDSNRARVIQGQRDTPLAAAGIEQAERLASSLAARGEAFEHLISSDLQRASQTAAILGRALGLEVVEDSDLREADYGDWTGKSYDDYRVLADAVSPDRYQVVAPGGESVALMSARVCAAFDRWMASEGRSGRALLVSHGGCILALINRHLGLPLNPTSAALWLRSNTGVTILRRSRRDPGSWRLVTLNATPHLVG